MNLCITTTASEYYNNGLRIDKEVVGLEDASNKEFTFEVNMTDANGGAMEADYSIVRHESDGTVIDTKLLDNGEGTFSLKGGEYVTIDYLPIGTKYTITETNVSGGCTVYNTVSTPSSQSGGDPTNVTSYTVTAEGEIVSSPQGGSSVLFVNTFRPKLPETGGSGTLLYTTGGTALLAAALLYDIRRRKAQRSKPQ